MPRVTVCIPAFESGIRIAETLRSVQEQSFTDFRVRVAIEPTGANAFDPDVERRFSADPRFSFYRNDEVLGWAGNIDRLMSAVDTELFAILPHDDLWERDYLGVLVDGLARQPAAAVCYADIGRLGERGGAKTMVLDNASLGARLLTFYLRNANAVPWRGVTRSSVLLRSGPNFAGNPFESYGAECEWAQRLLLRGAARRVPMPLYRKRHYPPDHPSVSRRWISELSRDRKEAALEMHRQRMLAGIPMVVEGDIEREAIVLACEVAMLRRAWRLGRFGLTGVRGQRAMTIRAEAKHLAPERRKKLLRYLDRVVNRMEASAARPADRGSA